MLDIQPQYLSLAQLLEKRLFVIPEYQRAYSWTSHQRNDLFGDIENTFNKGDQHRHFMAAVVCLRRKRIVLGADEYHISEIVDGQQRLTTLILLLKSIQLSLGATEKKEAKLAKDIAELLVKLEGEELLLLQTNHDTSHHFENYLRRGTTHHSDTAITIADRELLTAIEECHSFVKKWIDKGRSAFELAVLIKNRLFFLLHEIVDEGSVYTVFEVLNSRGLDVSWIDRLKSILMGKAFELHEANRESVVKDLHVFWKDIYDVIGLRQGLSTESLRFAATLWTKEAPSRPLGEQDAVDLLREKASNATQIRKAAKWLLDVVGACDNIAANNRLNAVTRIAQARLLAVAIHLRTDLSTEQKEPLLDLWERVSFRIYGMLRYDARTRVGDYVRLAWKIINEDLTVSAIRSGLTELGADFPISTAVEALRDKDCYEGWESELRYFMFRYEEHLARQQNMNFSNEQWEKIWMVSPSDSIEHIWPKSKAPDKLKHRLGNLTLLPPRLNSKLQDIPAAKKSESYRKTGLLIATDVATIINKKGWTGRQIKVREEELIKWAAKEWAD